MDHDDIESILRAHPEGESLKKVPKAEREKILKTVAANFPSDVPGDAGGIKRAHSALELMKMLQGDSDPALLGEKKSSVRSLLKDIGVDDDDSEFSEDEESDVGFFDFLRGAEPEPESLSQMTLDRRRAFANFLKGQWPDDIDSIQNDPKKLQRAESVLKLMEGLNTAENPKKVKKPKKEKDKEKKKRSPLSLFMKTKNEPLSPTLESAERVKSIQITSEATLASELPKFTKHLTSLIVSNVQLTNAVDLTKCPSMEHLSMNQNNLSSFPNDVRTLNNLITLSLYHNQLRSLPPSLSCSNSLVTLNLQINQLLVFPSKLCQLKVIKSLDLSRNLLSTLPKDFSRLTSLTHLNLASNQLSSLPPFLDKLVDLNFLDLSANFIPSFNHGPLDNLAFLSLNNNGLKEFSIGPSPALTELILSQNRLTELPNLHCPSLILLDVSENQLTKLSRDFAQHCLKLQRLKFQSNSLKSLPDTLFSFVKLKTIDVSHNFLTTFPASLLGLKELQVINVGFNQIRGKFGRSGIWPKLTTLILSSNELEAVPSYVDFSKLKTFSVNGNPLSSGISEEEMKALVSNKALTLFDTALQSHPQFADPSKLERIYLSFNDGITLPIGSFSRCSSLTELYFCGVSLSTIPVSVLTLSCLKKLVLTRNKITSIPSQIGDLTNLTVLDLSCNQLTKIPSSISSCTNLTEITLSFNSLSRVNEKILKLQKLEVLNLSNNSNLSVLMVSLAKMPSLTELDLSDCRINNFFDASSAAITSLKFVRMRGNPLVTPIPFEWEPLVVGKIAPPSSFHVEWEVSSTKGRRPRMEDTYVIEESIPGSSIPLKLMALFDGFGGSQVSTLCASEIANIISRYAFDESFTPRDFEEVMVSAVDTLSHLAKEKFITSSSGTTGGIVVLSPAHIHVAVFGEVQCVVYENFTPTFVSEVHSGQNNSERLRVQRLGGFVSQKNSKINAAIRLSRAVGAAKYEPFVSHQAEAKSIPYPKSAISFTILASDGLWDSISPQYVGQLASKFYSKHKSLEGLSVHLRDYAFLSGSMDNICIIVLKL
eukprot:TRINITY_DN3050_c1_g1_i1.p1 TRINITY_DN3050_c1_g1~~TRINITY_DN3050_c1_g1_i1.p1  ORF type:complete len:1067 (+),score=266.47 TRINITY_DN3050_c1_g1_i1:60-3203(+)